MMGNSLRAPSPDCAQGCAEGASIGGLFLGGKKTYAPSAWGVLPQTTLRSFTLSSKRRIQNYIMSLTKREATRLVRFGGRDSSLGVF